MNERTLLWHCNEESLSMLGLNPLEQKAYSTSILDVFAQELLYHDKHPAVLEVRTILSLLTLPTDLPIKVSISRSDEINAYALPTGDIIISDALLKKLLSKDALAALLAHECSHIIRGDFQSSGSFISKTAQQRGAESFADISELLYLVDSPFNPYGAFELSEVLLSFDNEHSGKRDSISIHTDIIHGTPQVRLDVLHEVTRFQDVTGLRLGATEKHNFESSLNAESRYVDTITETPDTIISLIKACSSLKQGRDKQDKIKKLVSSFIESKPPSLDTDQQQALFKIILNKIIFKIPPIPKLTTDDSKLERRAFYSSQTPLFNPEELQNYSPENLCGYVASLLDSSTLKDLGIKLDGEILQSITADLISFTLDHTQDPNEVTRVLNPLLRASEKYILNNFHNWAESTLQLHDTYARCISERIVNERYLQSFLPEERKSLLSDYKQEIVNLGKIFYDLEIPPFAESVTVIYIDAESPACSPEDLLMRLEKEDGWITFALLLASEATILTYAYSEIKDLDDCSVFDLIREKAKFSPDNFKALCNQIALDIENVNIFNRETQSIKYCFSRYFDRIHCLLYRDEPAPSDYGNSPSVTLTDYDEIEKFYKKIIEETRERASQYFHVYAVFPSGDIFHPINTLIQTLEHTYKIASEFNITIPSQEEKLLLIESLLKEYHGLLTQHPQYAHLELKDLFNQKDIRALSREVTITSLLAKEYSEKDFEDYCRSQVAYEGIDLKLLDVEVLKDLYQENYNASLRAISSEQYFQIASELMRHIPLTIEPLSNPETLNKWNIISKKVSELIAGKTLKQLTDQEIRGTIALSLIGSPAIGTIQGITELINELILRSGSFHSGLEILMEYQQLPELSLGKAIKTLESTYAASWEEAKSFRDFQARRINKELVGKGMLGIHLLETAIGLSLSEDENNNLFVNLLTTSETDKHLRDQLLPLYYKSLPSSITKDWPQKTLATVLPTIRNNPEIDPWIETLKTAEDIKANPKKHSQFDKLTVIQQSKAIKGSFAAVSHKPHEIAGTGYQPFEDRYRHLFGLSPVMRYALLRELTLAEEKKLGANAAYSVSELYPVQSGKILKQFSKTNPGIFHNPERTVQALTAITDHFGGATLRQNHNLLLSGVINGITHGLDPNRLFFFIGPMLAANACTIPKQQETLGKLPEDVKAMIDQNLADQWPEVRSKSLGYAFAKQLAYGTALHAIYGEAPSFRFAGKDEQMRTVAVPSKTISEDPLSKALLDITEPYRNADQTSHLESGNVSLIDLCLLVTEHNHVLGHRMLQLHAMMRGHTLSDEDRGKISKSYSHVPGMNLAQIVSIGEDEAAKNPKVANFISQIKEVKPGKRGGSITTVSFIAMANNEMKALHENNTCAAFHTQMTRKDIENIINAIPEESISEDDKQFACILLNIAETWTLQEIDDPDFFKNSELFHSLYSHDAKTPAFKSPFSNIKITIPRFEDLGTQRFRPQDVAGQATLDDIIIGEKTDLLGAPPVLSKEDASKIGITLLTCVLHQTAETGILHSNIHPGNIAVTHHATGVIELVFYDTKNIQFLNNEERGKFFKAYKAIPQDARSLFETQIKDAVEEGRDKTIEGIKSLVQSKIQSLFQGISDKQKEDSITTLLSLMTDKPASEVKKLAETLHKQIKITTPEDFVSTFISSVYEAGFSMDVKWWLVMQNFLGMNSILTTLNLSTNFSEVFAELSKQIGKKEAQNYLESTFKEVRQQFSLLDLLQ
jgi:hypothetical protein